jgi:hypothetical protein
VSETANTLKRCECEYLEVKQAGIDGRYGNTASRCCHPVIDFDLHIVKSDELNILQLAF